MEVLPDVDALSLGSRIVVTVGVFDGMHRGHTSVIATTVEAARRLDADPVVITFDPHPEAVLRGVEPPLLSDPAERLALLAHAGVRCTVVQPFDEAFRSQTAHAFVERVRAGRTLVGLVMTPESAFGRDRGGTPDVLRDLGARLAFELIEAVPLAWRGDRISSSRVRRAVESGALADARAMLGRRYAVIGEVVHGDGRGRRLGYPTANLAFAREVVLPPNGVYAVSVSWGGADPLAPSRTRAGVASLGVRPTFGEGARVLEVHLFDFDEEIYGERLRVAFVRRQRGERRFASVEALVEQMDRDSRRARELLAGAPTERLLDSSRISKESV